MSKRHVKESSLKSALMLVLKDQLPGFVALRHEDVRTNGIPDLSLTGNGRTSWIEVKHGTPDFESTGIQELTMLRLAAAGYARYLVYREIDDKQVTMIIHPRNIRDLQPEKWCIGYDNRWVANYFRELHQS